MVLLPAEGSCLIKCRGWKGLKCLINDARISVEKMLENMLNDPIRTLDKTGSKDQVADDYCLALGLLSQFCQVF